MKLDITLCHCIIVYETSEGKKRLKNYTLPPKLEKKNCTLNKKNMEISKPSTTLLLALSYISFRLHFHYSAAVHGGKGA
jgi:hypothetical protein